ncbi:MAG: hypothetical protein EP339_06615 [Gammaproteobacteria bacterium]|nr:MAG: hypothetical protein EP339_06615 [Gammaproteobacteria bacterium]
MTLSNHQEAFAWIAREQDHFEQAPNAFLNAWRQGVALAGIELFGDGTQDTWEQATDKWDLRPNLLLINDTIDVMSSGQKRFLAALVSFYNSQEGGALFRRVGIEGLADLSGLDLTRREVIAALILNYCGW